MLIVLIYLRRPNSLGDFRGEVFFLHLNAFANLDATERDELPALRLHRLFHRHRIVQDELLVLQAHFLVILIHATG